MYNIIWEAHSAQLSFAVNIAVNVNNVTTRMSDHYTTIAKLFTENTSHTVICKRSEATLPPHAGH